MIDFKYWALSPNIWETLKRNEDSLYSRISCTGGDYNLGHEKFQYKTDMNFGLIVLVSIIIKMFNLGRI